MKKHLLLATGTAVLLALSTSSFADFTFVNKTGDNILIQPANHSQYCAKHEAIPRAGYFISLGSDDNNDTSVNITGKGNPGRTCTQSFNIYKAPGANTLLGYLTIQTHDTDAHVDQQVLTGKGSKLVGTVSKDGAQVTITD